MGTGNDPEVVRRERVRQLWQAYPVKNRTATGVLIFYGWLEKQHPELLPPGQGDPYQHVKEDLAGLIEADKPPRSRG